MHSCLLPAWFAALSGGGPPLVLHQPTALLGIETPLPPVTGKAYPFATSTYVYDTDNFTVQWDDPTIPDSVAAWVAANAEEAWAVFLEEEGWIEPPTSAAYRLLVYLDPTLEAAGLATFMPDSFFLDGVPVIYINPDYAEYPEYFEGVVHHEFSHAIQFAMRDWYAGGPEEWWYWEASSTWMQEYVRPGTHQSAWLSSYYVADTTLAFDTVDYGHEYAMYMLNMYLGERTVGRPGFQSIWMDHEGGSWLSEIARVTEEPPPETWAKFAGAYFSRKLSDSHYFEYPVLETIPGSIEGHLGAQYLNLGEVSGTLWLDEGIGTVVRDGDYQVFWERVAIPAGSGDVTLIVTNPSGEPLNVVFSVEADTIEDTGLLDTGFVDTGAVDTDTPEIDTGDPEDDPPAGTEGEPGGESETSVRPPRREKSGGCSTVSAVGGLWWAGCVALFRRRFGSRTKSPRR